MTLLCCVWYLLICLLFGLLIDFLFGCFDCLCLFLIVLFELLVDNDLLFWVLMFGVG